MKSKQYIVGIVARLVATWLALVAMGVQAQTPLPKNSGSASSIGDNEAKALQGNRAKHETDLFTGSFVYSIPIEAAPARNGSEPRLALTYSSSGENGWCGVGWNLEIGYIERYTKDGIPVLWSGNPLSPQSSYDDSKGFRFNLFGKEGRLILISGSEYRAEIEGDFLRFVFDSGANLWHVYDKGGNHYYFGQANSSRMKNTKTGWPTGSTGTFRWALDRIMTVTGDSTTISYLTYTSPTLEKMLYPDTISYNGHTNNNGYTAVLAPTHTIQFITEARAANDRSFSYRSAFRVEQNRRLKRIYCRVGAQVVRRYELTYRANNSPTTKRSLLESVQVYGNNDSSTLPSQSFTYSAKPFSFNSTLTDWLDMSVPASYESWWETVTGSNPDEPGALVADLIDIDGDALPDRVRRIRTLGATTYDNFKVQRNRNIQADGTGRFAADYNFGPTPSQGYNDSGATTWAPYWSAINSGYTRFLDIDGDGRPDRVMDHKDYYLVIPHTYNKFVVAKNTGAGFGSEVNFTGVDVQGNEAMNSIENTYTVAMFDINGDGISDRVMIEPNAGMYDYLMVQLGTGSGFSVLRRFGPFVMQGKTGFFFGLNAGWDGGSQIMKFIDINGDGLPDRVMLEMADRTGSNDATKPPQSTTKFVVEFNNGYNFEEADWPGVYAQYNVLDQGGVNLSGGDFTAIENFPFVGLFDINGDHLPDRVMYKWADHSKWLVQINNGTGFEPQVDFNNVLRPAGAPDDMLWYGINGANGLSAVMDMNGDGLVDRVIADYNALTEQGGAITGFHINLNSGMVPDLMLTANNGIGGTTTVQYKPSTTWDNRKDTADANSARMLPFVVQSVNTVAVSDGINPARTTTYTYGGGFFDPTRREFAGFACVTNTDPSSRQVVHYFHQGGGRDNAANGEYNDAGNFAKRGMAYRVETYGKDTPTPLLYNVVVNQVEQDSLGSGRYFPYVKHTFEFDYPGGGTPNATATKYVYDNTTGNLTKKVLYGKVTGWNLTTHTFTTDVVPADTQYHHISYATISGNTDIKEHPDTLKLTSDDAGSTIVQEAKYTYNPNSGTVITEKTRISSGQYAEVTHDEYDAYGLATRLTDPVGVQTKITAFDGTYHIYPSTTRARIAPPGDSGGDHISSTDYDARSGLLTAATDPMGVSARNVYDAFFRLTESYKTPFGGAEIWVKKLTYNLGGITGGSTSANYVRMRVQDGVDSANGIESWAYADGLGRVIETRTEAEAANQFRVVNTIYDARGEVFLTTWPRLLTSSGFSIPSSPLAASYIGFDAAGRVSETRQRVDAVFNGSGVYQSKSDSNGDPGSPSPSPLAAKQWAYAYNNGSGLDPWWIVFTDEDGKGHRYLLDGFGRTNVIHEVDGGSYYTTTLNYDLPGNLTEIINQNAEHIYYGYDDAGRMVAMADPHLGTWTYRRDRVGRLREQTDAKGQKVVFTYGANGANLGRLNTKQVYNAAQQLVSTATYTYDSGDVNHTVYKGQLFQVIDSEGWEKNGYDTRGRLQKTTRHLNINNQDYVTTYGYNDGDKITSTVYPNSGPTVNYEYHPAGTLKRVYRTGYDFYSTSAANFDEFGHVLQFSYGNGKATTRSYYTTSKRLQSLSVPSVLSKSYRYSAADDVTFISSTGISDTSITYDNLHRIQNYSTGTSGNYTYDAVGNITRSAEGGASTYAYGFTRLQAVKTAFNKTYLYDQCGNMIVRRGDTAGSQALDYDAENRLTRFSQAGTVVVEYGYAADGKRLWKRKNKDATKLQIWIGNIYEEKEQDGTRKTLFHVFAGGQRICTFEPSSTLNGGPNPSATHVGYYYHQDHLNSSSALSGDTGSQLEVNVYYPFGRTQTATPQAAFKISNQFTGQVKDEETGLYYYGARYFDPELGRFTQPDTLIPDLGNPQSYNRYAYCLNNPLKYVDPDGHGVKDVVNSVFNFGGGIMIGAMNVWNPIPVQLRPAEGPSSSMSEYYGRRTGEAIGVGVSMLEIYGGGSAMIGGAGIMSVGGLVEVGTAGLGTLVVVPAEAVGGVLVVGGAVVTTHGAIGLNNFVFSTTQKPQPPNPHGSKGKPDHQQKVDELGKKAQSEAREGETVLRERRLQGHDSNRRPDQQIVDKEGKARKVFEAERKPNSQRNVNREAEYDKLGVERETHPLNQ